MWNKKWFGFWREDGAEFDDCPSAASWVDPVWKTEVDIKRVVQYLDGAELVWAESPPEMCLICSPASRIGKGCKTDGVWFWSGQLAHQVEVHDIRLPPGLADRIVAAGYAVPTACGATGATSLKRWGGSMSRLRTAPRSDTSSSCAKAEDLRANPPDKGRAVGPWAIRGTRGVTTSPAQERDLEEAASQAALVPLVTGVSGFIS
jgi:hypothetical protein